MRRFRLPLALAVCSAAVVLAFSGQWPWRRLQVAAPIVVSLPFIEVRDTLRRGETLAELFVRQGLAGFDLVRLLEAGGLDPRRLRAGLVVNFRRTPGDSLPHEATLRTGPEERLAIRRTADDLWAAERHAVAWRREVLRFEGAIDQSLYTALDETIPEEILDRESRIRLAWDLADVYAWSIDFNRDIQPGDRFTVLLERLVSEEGEVRPGRVFAANLLVGGKAQSAFLFEGEGRPRYYDAEGKSLRRAFLRAPVEFRRISSNFSRSRRHPVLGIWRAHQGTDYSAASGTPVLAAADGTVIQAGRAGGYGNLVELRHRNGITTRYAHLRGFARGVRSGARVQQGQVIGYVGSTGLATAAHLHYELRMNGIARDSRRIDLGGGEPIPAALRAGFLLERDRLLRELMPPAPVPVVAEAGASN